jgi:hypothetical protein
MKDDVINRYSYDESSLSNNNSFFRRVTVSLTLVFVCTLSACPNYSRQISGERSGDHVCKR